MKMLPYVTVYKPEPIPNDDMTFSSTAFWDDKGSNSFPCAEFVGLTWVVWVTGLVLSVTIGSSETNIFKTRGSVGWACVANLSFCFEET
jgi:hypothetical protein